MWELIWMFHSRCLNNKINSVHKRALRITYQDHISTLQELLNKGNSVSIHRRSFQALAREMLKIHRDLSPDILREIFAPKISSYNLRRNNTFKRRQVHTVYHCVKSVQIRSFLWSVFSRIRTEYGEILRIQSECGKIRTRKNSVFGHFSRSVSRHLIAIFSRSKDVGFTVIGT